MIGKQVWKFELHPTDNPPWEQEYDQHMPVGAEIVHIDLQKDRLCLWAAVDPEVTERERRTFFLTGTGFKIPENYRFAYYLKTIQQGEYVWHLFEVGVS